MTWCLASQDGSHLLNSRTPERKTMCVQQSPECVEHSPGWRTIARVCLTLAAAQDGSHLLNFRAPERKQMGLAPIGWRRRGPVSRFDKVHSGRVLRQPG